MPIRQTSFMLPASPSIPYLIEDIYVRGGFRSVATTTDRDALPTGARKVGMLVYCQDVDAYFKLSADKLTWLVTNIGVKGGSGSGGSGSGGSRQSFTVQCQSLAAGASQTLTFGLKSPTVMVLSLEVDTVDIQIKVYSKSDLSDANPYTFTSALGQLSDEGLTTISGSPDRVRKFAFWATQDGTVNHQVTVLNLGLAVVAPTFTVKYLTME